jgi:diphosphomevalonate decarboxylase
VVGGFVEWPAPPGDDPEAPAAMLFPAEHWNLADVIAIVESREKPVTSLDGHRRAPTSPHFEARRTLLPTRLAAVRMAIEECRLDLLGPVLEEEAIELHLIAMSSRPPIFYWLPATLSVLAAVRGLRDQGLPAWATMDAGANVHVICEQPHAAAVAAALTAVAGVEEVLVDGVGSGPQRIDEPLF